MNPPRIRWIIPAFFFLVFSIPVFGDETYTVKQMLFLPPTYYVGDLVEVRLRIDVADGVAPVEPTEFPEPSSVAIHDVRVIPISGEYDVRISFSSFNPGTRMLPHVELGDLIVKDIRIHTNSLIEDRNLEFVGAFDPVYLPGSRLLLALSVGTVLVLPVLIIGLLSWVRKLSRSIGENRRERQPYRTLSSALSELAVTPPPVDSRDFYIKLSDGFKRYLSYRISESIQTCTSKEVEGRLEDRYRRIPQLNLAAQAMPFFDQMKFGGRKVSSTQRRQDIELVREAALALESFLHELAQPQEEGA